ncbi:hypothetical protein NDU88_002790, partial [Pleurodeles waltl]
GVSGREQQLELLSRSQVHTLPVTGCILTFLCGFASLPEVRRTSTLKKIYWKKCSGVPTGRRNYSTLMTIMEIPLRENWS